MSTSHGRLWSTESRSTLRRALTLSSADPQSSDYNIATSSKLPHASQCNIFRQTSVLDGDYKIAPPDSAPSKFSVDNAPDHTRTTDCGALVQTLFHSYSKKLRHRPCKAPLPGVLDHSVQLRKVLDARKIPRWAGLST